VKYEDLGFGAVKLTPETDKDVESLHQEFPHLWPFEAVCVCRYYKSMQPTWDGPFRG